MPATLALEEFETAVLTGDLERALPLWKALRSAPKEKSGKGNEERDGAVTEAKGKSGKPGKAARELQPLDHDHPMEGMEPGEHTRHLRFHEQEYALLKRQLAHEEDPDVRAKVTEHMRACVTHWNRHRQAKHCPPPKESEKLVKPEDVDRTPDPVSLLASAAKSLVKSWDEGFGLPLEECPGCWSPLTEGEAEDGLCMGCADGLTKAIDLSHAGFRQHIDTSLVSVKPGEVIPYGPFRVRIENPAGHTRKGKGPHGAWETTMRWAYGEIVGTEGTDGDPVDVFLGPSPCAPLAFIVHQHDLGAVLSWPGGCCPSCGHPPAACPHSYDEDKVFLGFGDEEEAKAAFLLSYDDDRFMGPVDAVPVALLPERLKARRGRLLKGALDTLLLLKALPEKPQKHPLLGVSPDGAHVYAHTPHYHPPFVQALKSAIPHHERKWNGGSKRWEVAGIKHLGAVGKLLHAYWDAAKHPKGPDGKFLSLGKHLQKPHPLHDMVHHACQHMSGMDMDHAAVDNGIGWNGTHSQKGHEYANKAQLTYQETEHALGMLGTYKNTQLAHLKDALWSDQAEQAVAEHQITTAAFSGMATKPGVEMPAAPAKPLDTAGIIGNASHPGGTDWAAAGIQPTSAPEGTTAGMTVVEALQALGGSGSAWAISAKMKQSIGEVGVLLLEAEKAGQVHHDAFKWMLGPKPEAPQGFAAIPMDQWAGTKPWDAGKDYAGLASLPAEVKGWKSHCLTLSPEAVDACPHFDGWQKDFLKSNLGKAMQNLSYKQVEIVNKLQKLHKGWCLANPGVIPTLFEDYQQHVQKQHADKAAAEQTLKQEKLDLLAEQSNQTLEYPPGMNLDAFGGELFPHQKAGVNWLLKAKRGILALATGLGKALDNDTQVLTPKGWVRNGDLKVGDFVIAGDGTPTEVLGVYPQGEVECFRVGFTDGSSVLTCGDHLWHTRTRSERTCKKGPKPGAARTTREIAATLTVNAGGGTPTWNHSVPMVGPVRFLEQEVGLHPYLMGVLLGDAHFGPRHVALSNPEEFILKMVSEVLPEGTALRRSMEGRCDYHISAGQVPHAPGISINPVMVALRGMGLSGKNSHEKHLPEEFKFNTREVRLAVLRGLMDTDGWVSKDGVIVQFVSTSLQLAQDVQFLVQSFGGTATIKPKEPKYTYKGEVRQGRTAYTVHLAMPPEINPFLLPRKAARVVPKTKYPPRRYVSSVEPVGSRKATCIRVAHPSSLYVTEHFLVTHNTATVVTAFEKLKHEGKATRMGFIVPKGRLVGTARDIEQLFPGKKIVLLTGTKLGKNTPFPANVQVFEGKITEEAWAAAAEADYVVSGYDPVLKNSEWFKANCDVMSFDECCPAGTLIQTPDGPRKIEDIRPGDWIYGFDHRSGVVVPSRVKNSFKKWSTAPFFRVGGTLLTGEHPVYTEERGYVPAKECDASYHYLRSLWTVEGQGEQGQEPGASVLRQGVLHWVSDAERGGQGTITKGNEGGYLATGSAGEAAGILPVGWLLPEETGRASESARDQEEAGLSDAYRRKWAGPYRAAAALAGATARLEARVRHWGKSVAEGLSTKFQGGHCFAFSDAGGGAGWAEPSLRFPEGTGPAQGGVSALAGLDSSSLPERSGDERSGSDSDGHTEGRWVYNLETETRNYFAEGLLVHNCVRLKGKDSKISHEVQVAFKETPNLWYMSATPIPNHPMDLFVLMRGLNPKVFGSLEKFKKDHCKVQYNPYTHSYDIKGYKDVQATHGAVEHLIYHRNYESPDVLVSMPERSYEKQVLDMPPQLQAEFNVWKQKALAEALAKGKSGFNQAQALVELMRLEQISITPRLLNPNYKGPEPKLERAGDMAKDHFDEQGTAGKVPPKGIIFFSHYLEAQPFLAEHLKARAGLADGEIATIKGSDYRVGGKKVKTIQDVVDAMNMGKVKALIASDAAMEGLNLQYGATKLVHLDTPWRPDALEQREGRIYRPGQKEKCHFTRLLLDNTVENKKDQTVEHKAKNQSAIIAGEDVETDTVTVTYEDFIEALGG
jgi:hypothetical protein